MAEDKKEDTPKEETDKDTSGTDNKEETDKDTSGSDSKEESNKDTSKEETDKKDEDDSKDSSDKDSKEETSSSGSDAAFTGIVMNWNLVPVEDQKPQINWRQNINSDDKPLNKLQSYQMNQSNLGANGMAGCSLQQGDLKDYMKKNYDEMKAGKGNTSYLPNDNDIVGKVDNLLSQMEYYSYQTDLEEIAQAHNMDPVFLAALITIESGGYPNAGSSAGAQGLMQTTNGKGGYYNSGAAPEDVKQQHADAVKSMNAGVEYYISLRDSTGTENPCINSSLYNCGPGWFDDIGKEETNESTGTTSKVKPTIKGDSTWAELIEYMEDLPTESKEYFPKIVYAYINISGRINKTTKADNPNGLSFPIANADFKNTYFYKNFGTQNQTSGVTFVSEGIVLKVPKGTKVMTADICSKIYGEDTIHGKYVTITCTSSGYEGFKITYCNLSDYKEPSKAKDSEYYPKGAVIGLTGNSGNCNNVECLTIVIKDKNDKAIDPTGASYWPILKGAYSQDASKSLKDCIEGSTT